MKSLYVGILSLFVTSESFAQISVGVQGATASSHTDATPGGTNLSFGGNVQYSPLNYLTFKANLNAGKLQGGLPNEVNLMFYKNNFIQADVLVKLYPFATLSSQSLTIKYLSKIYGGVGIGLLRSNTSINMLENTDMFNFIANYKGVDLVYPVELGIDIPMGKIENNPKFSLNVFGRYNFLGTDKMDGYKPNLSSNKSKDAYSSIGIGIKYSLSKKKKDKNEDIEVNETPKFND